MICVRCHRPLKNPPGPHGMGPTCEKTAAPISDGGRDLFGFDVDRATDGAVFRLELHIAVMAAETRAAVRHAFAAARERLGIAA